MWNRVWHQERKTVYHHWPRMEGPQRRGHREAPRVLRVILSAMQLGSALLFQGAIEPEAIKF